ncbi:MAG: leucine-rich repeat protein [Clostridiales bacterium]|jgi:hypothetical protein|nr:leucine-rich repeat protein [Clostridiales bacterium]
MKRKHVPLFLLLAALICLPFVGAQGSGTPISDFSYSINEGQVFITGYKGTGGDVVIPSEIEGLPVVSIGQTAFLDNLKVQSVWIPRSVRRIEFGAFSGCSNLNSISFAYGLTSIG